MNVKRLTCLTITGMMLLSGCSAGKTVNNKSVVASLDGDNVYADSIYSKAYLQHLQDVHSFSITP